MPKSKKKKNKDFQKVKLKVGKRLPKADNETRTSFKAATIQVPQQLTREDQGTQPTTRRKLGLGDLLIQLNHYNASVRHSAIAGLRELTATSPALLTSNLGQIVSKISELFTDKDAVVRQAVIRLLKALLPQVSTNQITPFFSVTSAHLCCAMTHIYEDIRMDSLPIIDIFLENFPKLVTNKSSQILPNFIEQISTKKLSGKSESSRSLSLNPTSKMSSLKWRVGVLERLQKFLTAMAVCTSADGTSTFSDKSLDSQSKCLEDVWVSGCQPFAPCSLRSWNSYGYLLDSRRSNLTPSVDIAGDSGELQLSPFISTLLPLLVECWVEATVVDDRGRKSDNNGLVSAESLVVMVNVVMVIQLLWKYAQKTSKAVGWFPDKCRGELSDHLLSGFPYSVHNVSGKRGKKQNTTNHKEDILSLNLAVCDIMTSVMLLPANRKRGDSCENEPITSFLLSTLQEEKLSSENLSSVVNTVRQVLAKNTDEGFAREITKACYKLSSTVHPLSQEKRTLLAFLGDLVLQPEYQVVAENRGVLIKFLSELPALLMTVSQSSQQGTAQILHIIQAAVVQGKMVVSPDVWLTILDPETDILQKLSEENQKSVIEILYRVPCLDRTLLKTVAGLLRSASLPTNLACYLIQTLSHRYADRPTKDSADLGAYLSFLVTVTLGVSGAEANADQVFPSTLLGGHVIKGLPDHMTDWRRQHAITMTSLLALSHVPHQKQTWSALSAFLQSFLSSNKSMNCSTAWACVQCVSTLCQNQPISNSLAQDMVSLSLSLLHWLVVFSPSISQSDASADRTDYRKPVWKAVITFLKSHDHGLCNFLQRFQEDIQRESISDIESAVQLLTEIVRDLDLVTYLDVDFLQLKKAVKAIEMSNGDSMDRPVLTQLRYHISLLQHHATEPQQSPNR